MAFALFKGLFGGDDIYGSKPKVPDFTAISPKEAQKKALDENLANFGDVKNLAKKVNKFNQGQLLSMLRAGIPNYDALVKTGGEKALSLLNDENIAAMRRGEIPADVAAAIQQSGAEKAVAGGFEDTGASRNLVARDLGLKSLDLIEQGFTATQSALSSTEKWLSNVATLTTPGLFNVSSMFFTPQQQYSMMAQERDSQMAHDWLEAQVKAAPNPSARGQFDTEMSILSSYLGTSYGGWNKPSYTQPTQTPTGAQPGGNSQLSSFYGGFGGASTAGNTQMGAGTQGGVTSSIGAGMGSTGGIL